MTTRSLVLQPKTGHENVSPAGFRRWAQHYMKCRKDFVSPDAFSPVPYFLLCRAIELELKAMHLETLRVKQVKDKFGHKLLGSYRALPAQQQLLSDAEVALLTKASRIYESKGFEYFSVYEAGRAFAEFPDLGELDQLAARVIPHAV